MAQQIEPKSCGHVHSAPSLHGNPSLFGLDGALPVILQRYACIVQPLHKHLSGEGASRKNEHAILTDEALDAFEMLKKAGLEAPVLAFADFNKPFLLETNASKSGLKLCNHKNRLKVDTIW